MLSARLLVPAQLHLAHLWRHIALTHSILWKQLPRRVHVLLALATALENTDAASLGANDLADYQSAI